MPTQPYFVNGKRVPGVTTITSVYDGGKSRGLMSWAAKLGLEGIDAREYRDRAATIGTVAHDICTATYLGTEPDMLDLTPGEIGLAENSALTFFEWIGDKDFTAECVERPFTHEELRFGGCPDLYGVLDGVRTLIDLKTSKTIYLWQNGKKALKREYALQMGGYALLLERNGHPVDRVVVLGISKSEDYDFEEYAVQDIAECMMGFTLCRRIYDTQGKWK